MRHSNFARLLFSLPFALVDLIAAQQSPLTPITLPSIDLSSFGLVGLGGDFDGISLYQFAGQNLTTQQGTGDGVCIQLPNGGLGLLGRAHGTISSLCALNSGLFVGGTFDSIAGVNASNIAAWNFTTLTFEKLNDRDILGSVATLYCDRVNNQVYVGGDFQSGGSNNAIIWNQTEGHWIDLPFSGFDGPVSTIQSGDSNTILFGGVFDALGNGTVGGINDRQVINLVNATVTSDGTTSTAGFTDPSVLFCSNGTDGPGSTWLLRDNTPGDMTVLGNFGYRPTKLRLRNTHFQGRGTKTFRFVALPIDGIMNFTYVDPTTGATHACDATCPLSNNANIEFQDFEFVNVIGINGFTLFISDWYGSGGGLSGLELFEDDIVAYADNSFNEPTCQVPTLGSTASTTGGPFTAKGAFPETSASYLSFDTGGTITMEPKILESGNYSIRLFTPGCVADGTCLTRGIVNVTTFFNENEEPSVTQIFQTNDFDKYDTIFQGRVQAGSTSFRPRVIISPAEGQPPNQDIVAQKVQFMPLGLDGVTPTTDSTIGSSGSLNGLFQYAPLNWTGSVTTENMTFNAAFDIAGTDLGFDANIVAVTELNGRIFVAGDFSSTQLSLENVMVITDGTPESLPFGGLNGPVNSVATFNGTMYFGGQFTGTANQSTITGLNNVAAFDTNSNTWVPLGQGLNGNITNVVLCAIPTGVSSNETVVVFSGQFNQILGSPPVDVSGLAFWVPSQNNWAERLGAGAPFAMGSVTAEAASSNGTVFVAGPITSWQESRAESVIGLGNTNLNSIPLGFSPSTNTTQKRSLNSQDTMSPDVVITAGAFYTGNNENITIVAGHFTLAGATNLAFIDGKNNDVSGLPAGSLPANASIYALLVDGSRLYIGGDFTGMVNSNTFNALVFYDFSTSAFASVQPPTLTGDGVVVNALAIRPSNPQILVGGRFAFAGSLPCPAVCIYNSGNSQWQQPGNIPIDGEVSQIVFEDDNTALVVGNLSFGGNNTFVGRYNFQTNVWTSVDVGVSGPVESVLSQDSTTLYLAGQNPRGSYFGKWNGQQFQDLTTGLEPTSEITEIQFLPLSSDHKGNNVLSSDRVILLMGNIQLPDFGNASGVLYDGSSYEPYILSTKADGSSGIIYTFFSEHSQSFSAHGRVPLGWVIVIALAISLFLIVLLVIGGLIAARIRRAREGYVRAPTAPPIGESALKRVPPDQLLENLEGRSRQYPMV